MNDGSSDNTREILQSYACGDGRFRLLHHERPNGLTASLIEISSVANSDFLARQDADDWSAPDRLKLQHTALRAQPTWVAVGCDFAVHAADGTYLDTVATAHTPWTARRLLKKRNPFAHGSLLIRRSAFDQVGGYRPNFYYAQDYDLLLRLSEMGDVAGLKQTLYHHRLSVGGIGREKRGEQAACAAFARACANARKRGQAEPADDGFHSHRMPKENRQIDSHLIHYLKSGQTAAAQVCLDHWMPASNKQWLLKLAATLFIKLPQPIRRLILTSYHLFRLI